MKRSANCVRRRLAGASLTLAVLTGLGPGLGSPANAAGAADPKVDGKTAAEWEAEADRLLAGIGMTSADLDKPTAAASAARTAQPAAPPIAQPRPAAPAPIAPMAAATPVPRPAAGGAVIQSGRYTCIAGFRIMLTLGEMTITGNRYSFRPPNGPVTTGTWAAIGPRSFKWTGDIGVIKNSQIADSQFDGQTQTVDFWITYHLTPGDIPVNIACQKL